MSDENKIRLTQRLNSGEGIPPIEGGSPTNPAGTLASELNIGAGEYGAKRQDDIEKYGLRPEYMTKYFKRYQEDVAEFFELAKKDPDGEWQKYFAAIKPVMEGFLEMTTKPITQESVEKFKQIVAAPSQNSARGTTTENPSEDATGQ